MQEGYYLVGEYDRMGSGCGKVKKVITNGVLGESARSEDERGRRRGR